MNLKSEIRNLKPIATCVARVAPVPARRCPPWACPQLYNGPPHAGGPATHGFTLVEVLIVVTIITLLLALLLPSLGHARELARRAVCMSNLAQIATGINSYAIDNERRYPYRGWDWPNMVFRSGSYDMRPQLEPYASPEVFYCPSGGFPGGVDYQSLVDDADDESGWRNPYFVGPPWNVSVAHITYSIFTGIAHPSGLYMPFVPEMANLPILRMTGVALPSETPLASDLTFWEGGINSFIMHNHPYWPGYAISDPSPIYGGQATVFWDGHSEWRDALTVEPMMMDHPDWRWSW